MADVNEHKSLVKYDYLLNHVVHGRKGERERERERERD